MSAVKDLSILPIGTKIEKIENGQVVHTLHTVSLYENFTYTLQDENGNKCKLTIRDLMWGGYRIYDEEDPTDVSKESTVKEKPYRPYY